MAPPGVGGIRIKHNTRERVLSGDHNREQAVHDQMLAEILRSLTDASFELDQKAGSVEVFGDGTESLPRATILAGIRPRPEVGTINLFIEGGTMCIVDNATPNADESRLAFVVDPGIQTAGVLTLTPGSGGAIRIDVIECQRTETVLESDNRDIFNPSTGLFTPTLVDKVVAGRLTYRIRLGAPGLGFPGIAAGWLPLAVCSVPAAATTWDDVTLWDVRPLAHERVQQPFNAYPSLNYVHRHNVACDLTTVSSETRQSGVVDISYGGYRAGGQLIHPGTTNQYLDVANTTLWASGLASSNGLWYLYLVFPFGLPRWVQYSPASASIREPRGLRGIPVVSRWTPRYDGRPINTVAQTPAWTGLLDPASQNAIVALAGIQSSGSVPKGVLGDGQTIHFVDAAGVEISASSSSGNDWSQFTLDDQSTHAGCARAVWVEFSIRLDATVAGAAYFGQNTVTIGGPDGAYTNVARISSEMGAPPVLIFETGALGIVTRFIQRIPLPIEQAYSSPRTYQVRWTHNIAGSAVWTVGFRKLRVIGWELGP